MSFIKNRKGLIVNGTTELSMKARDLALASLEHALMSVNPKTLIRSKFRVVKSSLSVGGYHFDLAKFQHIYVIGGGKAAASMAESLEELLGENVTSGIVNVPHKSKGKTRVVELNGASHPIPDEAGIYGVKRMMEIAEKADQTDLIICLISGGGSSLMPLPIEGISLADKQALTASLLKSGAPINEINIVRKHLSCFKGGWLAKHAYPATMINLVISDVVGDSLDSIASGPTVPDSSTFSDAVNILKKYGLFDTAAPKVRQVLQNGVNGLIPETPKEGDPAFDRVYNVIIGNNQLACKAATDFLKKKGLNVTLLGEPLEGEARIAGAKLLLEVQQITGSAPFPKRPACVVVGGETTVRVLGYGIGGRNQELALSTALSIKECVDGFAIVSLSTDGIDGPTDAAGAVVDCSTLTRAGRLGLDPNLFLANNDSYTFFAKLDDLIKTGPTGTNVNDITVVVLL